MKHKSLQFTFFSKILFVCATLAFTLGVLLYWNLVDFLGPEFKSDDNFQAFYYSAYIIFTVVMGILIISVYVLSRQVTKPIESLAMLFKYIGAGNFDVKASDYIRSSDELGELALHFDHMASEIKSRNEHKNILQKLHGQELTEEFIKGALERKAVSVEIAVLFLDIRDFTKFSEAMPAEDVVSALNIFFSDMGDIIKKYNGVIDKFMGDSLMAVWGIPESSGEMDIRRSFACATEMHHLIESKDYGFQAGMGIDYGKAVLGCIGSKSQLDYTIIGDVVNTASRIQKLSKSHGVPLMVSDSIYQGLESSTHEVLSESLLVSIAGKSKPIKAYQLEHSSHKIKKIA